MRLKAGGFHHTAAFGGLKPIPFNGICKKRKPPVMMVVS
jgi:hypothetical protein